MDPAEFTILSLNVILGLTVGVAVARMFGSIGLPGLDTRKALTRLLPVYFFECVAFMASMGTSILSIALAVLWGILLGSRLRGSSVEHLKARRLAAFFALYTGLPAASFFSVPVIAVFSGWSVLTAEAGLTFGVPAFLPWPLNTILGFCVGVALGTLLLKMIIITGLVERIALRETRQLPDTA